MVLWLKPRESRSPPGLPDFQTLRYPVVMPITPRQGRTKSFIAGWSSPVARQAHNLKVRGSNPLPATNDPILPPEQPFPSWATAVLLSGVPVDEPSRVRVGQIQERRQVAAQLDADLAALLPRIRKRPVRAALLRHRRVCGRCDLKAQCKVEFKAMSNGVVEIITGRDRRRRWGRKRSCGLSARRMSVVRG